MRILVVGLLSFVLTDCGDGSSNNPSDGNPGIDAAGPETVELTRDERGVPHVFASSMKGAFYALGYASAQDRLYQMNLWRTIMRGRSAEFFAVEEAEPQLMDKSAYNTKLIKKDRYMRVMGFANKAEQSWSQLPGDVPMLLQAYADGVNAWVATPNFALGSAFEKAGITSFDPWQPADSLLVWDYVGNLFGSPKMQAEIKNLVGCDSGNCPEAPCDRPVDEDAAVVPPPFGGVWPPQGGFAFLQRPQGGERRPPVSLKASHGWAVSGERTTSGKPILMLDPKVPLAAPSMWYEFHLQVPSADVDVRGINFAGAPSMLIFWNRYVSQTLTAGSGDTGDLFEIMEGSQPGTYVVDGVDQTFMTRNETITVKHGSPISVDIEETTYGPIINSIVNNAPANRKFAVRFIEHYRLDQHSIVAGIRLMSATDLTSYRDALRYWMLPTANAVYAGVDKDAPANDTGHIAYHALVGMAKRAKTLMVSGLDFTGRHPQDGSDSSNDWQGVYDLEWNAHITDPSDGYLFSGNHMPVGTWYHDLFYSGVGGLGDSYRSFQLRTMLAGLFPTTESKITPQQAHEMHYDGGFYVGEILRDVLQHMEDRTVIVPAVPTAPTTPAEKTAKLLQVLDLWVAEGAELKSTSKYFRLLKNLPISLIGASRHSLSPEFSCKWHESQGGVIYFAKAYQADPEIMTGIETGFLMLMSEKLWDIMIDKSPEMNPDPTTWATPTTADVYTAKYHSAFFCNSFEEKCDSNTLDNANDVPLVLDRTQGDTVNAASTSSWPATADFADIDGSKALLAPGSHEEPSSSHYKDMVPAMENVSKGQDAIPLAPLSRDKLNLGSPEILTVP